MADEKQNEVSLTTSEPEVERTNMSATGEGLTNFKLETNGLHEYQENEGYIIDSSEGGAGVKLAEDGRTRLIPQPSDDPRDPLNWSWRKKHAILFIVAAAAFLPDYGSAQGAVLLQAQAEYVFPLLCGWSRPDRADREETMEHDSR